jgi:hypothetical protein
LAAILAAEPQHPIWPSEWRKTFVDHLATTSIGSLDWAYQFIPLPPSHYNHCHLVGIC